MGLASAAHMGPASAAHIQPSSRGRRRLLRWALAAAAVLALVLILSQLLLPGIVAANLRSTLRGAGAATDVHLSVAASPALELLFGHADRVSLSIGQLRPSGPTDVKALLERTREAGSVDATISRLLTQPLEFDDVTLRKRGGEITTTAAVSRAALAAALPAGMSLTAPAGGSDSLVVDAHISLLGQSISATALLQARDGKIELVPSSPLVPDITLFSDPQLAVDSLRVSSSGDAYTFTAHGHLI